jgi:hypothetical protein
LVGALSELIDFARKVAPSADANQAIAAMREETAVGAEPGLSYEVVVPAGEPWTYLTGTALPRLVYFLDCRGALSETAKGIFVSAFVGERLYFFDSGTFVGILARKAGLDWKMLREKWGEATGGPTASAAPKLLGG